MRQSDVVKNFYLCSIICTQGTRSDANKQGYAEFGTSNGYGVSLKQGNYVLWCRIIYGFSYGILPLPLYASGK